MDDVLPLCPLCLRPTDEPKLPCAECNETLPHAVQDWFHKAWFDGTVNRMTHEDVGEALRAMRALCRLADDPNLDLSASGSAMGAGRMPPPSAIEPRDCALSPPTAADA